MKPVKSESITESVYENSIPVNCRLTTLDDHASIMYCWGLLSSIKEGKPHKCGLCEFNSEYSPDEYARLFTEQLEKQKMWNVLNAKI